MGEQLDKQNLIRNRLAAGRSSPLKTYRDLTVGDKGTGYFILYELLTMLAAPMPGGLGLALRKFFYPRLFGSCGRGVIIGRNVVLRHPHRIHLADHVTIDDNCLLDGRGDEAEGIVLGEGVILNRNCLVQAKGGSIRIGERTTIGSNSVIVATRGAEIGSAVMFAGGCSVSAGAYQVDGFDGAIMDGEAFSTGPVRVGDGAWLGTSAVVLDGISVGTGAVIGAGAIVNRDIPDNAIAAGVPAKVLRQRRADSETVG